MRRTFKVVGTIDENTKVFDTTYGHVKGILDEGFQEQFRKLEASRMQQASTQVVVEVKQKPVEVAPRQVARVQQSTLAEAVAYFVGNWWSGDQMRAGKSAQALAVALAMKGKGRGSSPGAVRRGLKGKGLKIDLDTARLVLDQNYVTSIHNGQVVMTAKPSTDKPIDPPLEYGRRVGDKDLAR
ncbi:hypothetical protein [Massilia sp. HP4]|uniref:hypothetical protein n=1 Tax=Massilia sp. HP4 TaxID=2562316 RepID=UPI0010C0786E|nr:hypothetical protein [Massilia sp. HP4]